MIGYRSKVILSRALGKKTSERKEFFIFFLLVIFFSMIKKRLLEKKKVETYVGHVVVDVSILWAVSLFALFILKGSVVFSQLLAVL